MPPRVSLFFTARIVALLRHLPDWSSLFKLQNSVIILLVRYVCYYFSVQATVSQSHIPVQKFVLVLLHPSVKHIGKCCFFSSVDWPRSTSGLSSSFLKFLDHFTSRLFFFFFPLALQYIAQQLVYIKKTIDHKKIKQLITTS